MIPPRRPSDLAAPRAPVPPQRPEEFRGIYAGGRYFPDARGIDDPMLADLAASRDAQVLGEEMARIRAIPVPPSRAYPIARGGMLATRDNLYPERAVEEYDAQRMALGSMLAGQHTMGVPRGERRDLGAFPVAPMPPRRPPEMVPPPPPLPPSRNRLYATNDIYGETGTAIGPGMRERDMYGDGVPIGSGALPSGIMEAMRALQELMDALNLALGIDAAQRATVIPPPPPMVIEANVPTTANYYEQIPLTRDIERDFQAIKRLNESMSPADRERDFRRLRR